ncbi:hypothetical protein FSP39_014996 [Pinctada imbricata]|uniref:NADH:ubiquinone oxidoreductase intermediate-associated protein 30 domain-containing protein n=1 Tax=Pinctada imbricata TaxID=66713 RepID=A0AA88XVS0_PINIB|nr:hypothetical protein FSP39_014996 [Pinctada imbricata]
MQLLKTSRNILQKITKRSSLPSVTQVANAGGNIIIHNPSARGEGYHRDKEPFSRKDLEKIPVYLEEKSELYRRRFLYQDDYTFPFHRSYDYFWKFNSAEKLKAWILTTDMDNKEGFSKAYLSLSKSGKALFYGNLSTKVPEDGRVKKAGYCNMRSPINKYGYGYGKENYYNWTAFNHIVMRFRGDGRAYYLSIASDNGPGFGSDLFSSDLYSYPLFTRGGPYWQIAKIPFSKFYLNTYGRIQDRQEPLRKDFVKTFNIGAVVDDGPFHLEIDYIALLRDDNHDEVTAYEMYDLRM